jgi:hypothetical protein
VGEGSRILMKLWLGWTGCWSVCSSNWREPDSKSDNSALRIHMLYFIWIVSFWLYVPIFSLCTDMNLGPAQQVQQLICIWKIALPNAVEIFLSIMYANAKCHLQKTLSVKRNFLYNQVGSLFAYLLCGNPAVSWFKSANYTTDYSAQTENFAQLFVVIQLVQCQDPRSSQDNPKFDLYFTLSPSIYKGPQGILWFACVAQLGFSLSYWTCF